MLLLNLTLNTAADNVALDEALLEEAEQSPQPREVLRFWEPATPMIVVGRSSRTETEVRLDTCRQRGIPVVRRASGGAAIVAGPGCLMYALVLSYELRPQLRAIDVAHREVLGQMVAAISRLVPGVTCRGTSDLARADYKFSGNSVRCKRRSLLYHGTLLYDFDLPLVEACLARAPREPEYRRDRPHTQFIANLPLDADQLRALITAQWQATECTSDWPRTLTQRLVEEKYSRDEWTLRGSLGQGPLLP